jgi:hypothetical protein
MRLAVAIAAATLALVAAAAAAPTGDEPPPTRDCRSRGDPSNGVPPRFVREGDVVVGPVSFAGLALAAARTALERGEDGRYFRKTAAKVFWGSPVTVTVAEQHRAALALGYARANRLTATIRFEPCPPGTLMFGRNGRLRRVTVFPGGLSFTTPGCYELEVRVDRGRTYRRTISLGAGSC